MTTSPSYRNAPLVIAILEVKHPENAPLSRGELAGIKAALVKVLPLQSSEDQVDVQIAGPGAAGPTQRMRTIHRYMSRDRTTSAAFTPHSYSIETVSYRGWTGFRELAELVTTTLMDVAPVDGVNRIGLRYIDEIRVPGPDHDVPDWHQWIHRDLVAPDLAGLSLRPLQQQAVVQYATSQPGDTVTLRYGAVVGPPAVGDSPLVRAPAPKHGAFFLLDTDAAWEVVAGKPVPELDVTFFTETSNRLHEPVRALFEACLTEKLRKEVLDVE